MFLKEYFEKDNIENSQQTTTKACKVLQRGYSQIQSMMALDCSPKSETWLTAHYNSIRLKQFRFEDADCLLVVESQYSSWCSVAL